MSRRPRGGVQQASQSRLPSRSGRSARARASALRPHTHELTSRDRGSTSARVKLFLLHYYRTKLPLQLCAPTTVSTALPLNLSLSHSRPLETRPRDKLRGALSARSRARHPPHSPAAWRPNCPQAQNRRNRRR